DPADAEPFASQADDKRAPRLGVALADLHGFHRFLPLPPADLTTTRKLAAVQLETILPGQQDVLRWGIQRPAPGSALGKTAGAGSAQPAPCLLFATSQAVLDRATAKLAAPGAVSLLTAGPAALDALMQHAPAERRAALDVVLVEPGL